MKDLLIRFNHKDNPTFWDVDVDGWCKDRANATRFSAEEVLAWLKQHKDKGFLMTWFEFGSISVVREPSAVPDEIVL